MGNFLTDLISPTTKRTTDVVVPLAHESKDNRDKEEAERRQRLGVSRQGQDERAQTSAHQRAMIFNRPQDAVQGDFGAFDQTGAEQRDFRGQQQGLANLLQQQAAGTGGPSAAERMLQQNQENLTAQQFAAARGSGMASGLANRQAAMASGAAGSQMAGQAATMRAQEQLAAQGLLGDVLGAGRQGDFQAQQGALLRAQTEMDADIKQRAMNDDFIASLMRANLGNEELRMRGRLGAEEINEGVRSDQREAFQRTQDRNMAMLSAPFKIAGEIGASYAGR